MKKLFLIIPLLFAMTACTQYQGSVPIMEDTDNMTVNVCINQNCDYVCDGQADGREIKQAIIAVLAGGGGTVVLHTGDYDFTSSVNIHLAGKSLVIKGDGYNTKLTNSMTTSDKDGTLFVVADTATTTLSSVLFDNLSFVGNASCGAGIIVTNVHNIAVTNSKFTAFSNAGAWGSAVKTASSTAIYTANNVFDSNTNDINLGDSFTNNFTYMQSGDINTFSKLQSWVSDETLLKAGILTDAKYCIYDSASSDIICNSEGGNTESEEALRLSYNRIEPSSTNYVEVADCDEHSIVTTGELTIMLKFRLNKLNNDIVEGSNHYVNFMGKGERHPAQNYEYYFRYYNDDSPARPQRYSFYVGNAGGGLFAGSYVQDLEQVGDIVTLVGRCNISADRVSLAKNGVTRDTDTLSGYSITPTNTTSDLRFGRIKDSESLWSTLDMDFLDAAIWNRELSDIEVAALETTLPSSGLVDRYKFEEQASPTVLLSEGSHNGTIPSGGEAFWIDENLRVTEEPVRQLKLDQHREVGPYSSTILTTNHSYLKKVIAKNAMRLTEMSIRVTTQSGNIDLGIYSADGTLIGSTGSIACPASGVQDISFTSAVNIPAGEYYLAIAANNTTATFRTVSSFMLSDVYQATSNFPLADLSGDVIDETEYFARSYSIIAK